MTYNKYISIIGLAGIMAWLGFIVVINKISPFESMGLALSFFFITLFIALVCTFTVFGFYFRLWLYRNEIFYKHIGVSFRQALLLSVITIFCFAFQMMRVLTWWSGLLLVAIAVLLESYFSSRDSELT